MSTPEPAGTYDPASVTADLDSFPLSGWGKDAMIAFEEVAKRGEPAMGIAGGITFVRNPQSRHLRVKLTFLSTSLTYKRVAAMAEGQRTGAIPAMPFQLRDPLNGDTVSSAETFFEEVPFPSKGKDAADMTFGLFLANAAVERGATIPG